jgi:hypothetical protein
MGPTNDQSMESWYDCFYDLFQMLAHDDGATHVARTYRQLAALSSEDINRRETRFAGQTIP